MAEVSPVVDLMADPKLFLGQCGKKDEFVNKQGLKLASFFWPASTETVKGVIVIVHGHGAYLLNEFLKIKGPGEGNMYEGSWVEGWNRHGYSVCGIDSQSHGFSEGLHGLRCYANSFDDFVVDVNAFARSLKDCGHPKFPIGEGGVPLFLCGASLGGCIAAHAARSDPSLYQGVILLCPMLSLERLAKNGWNPYLRPIARLVSWLAPTLPVAETSRNTKFPLIQDCWDADALVWHGKTRARLAAEYLRVCGSAVQNMKSFDFPFICFHSENDTLVDVDGSKLLFKESPAADKELRFANSMWHVLTKEDGNEKLLEEILQWMDARL